VRTAAAFKGMEVDELIRVLNETISNKNNQNFIPEKKELSNINMASVPKADIRFLGIVPCPLRNVLVEKFDHFVSSFNNKSEKKLGWTMAGEGTAGGDVLKDIMAIANSKKYDRLVDLFTAVGKDIFAHNFYGGRIYKDNIWKKIGSHMNANPALENFTDPNGILRLLYGVPFIMSCRKSVLNDVPLPKTWIDLTNDKYKGKIALPTLDLPIIPDLLGGLYYHLGEENFQKFAANCSYDMHPAEVSSRRDDDTIPGVFIVPTHFAEISTSSGAIAVYPEDGSIFIPAFAAVKHNAIQETDEVLDFLTSKEYIQIFKINASMIPNHKDFTVEDQLLPLITRPWQDVFENNPLSYTTRLVEMIRKRSEL
jgi:ABC-type Fe3+ transport system substrate-binding protein